MTNYPKPFLKWAGGKQAHLDVILPELEFGNKSRLIIPFLGGGAVYMAAQFDKYMVADINPHLANVWSRLAAGKEQFVLIASLYFEGDYLSKQAYLDKRKQFNAMADHWRETGRINKDEQDIMANLFIYLNRHGFNGLVRYNKKGHLNVPYGDGRQPYFPRDEMLYFVNEKADNSLIGYADFGATMARARPGEVVFCDPPYLPRAKDGFIAYYRTPFTMDDHERLDYIAWETAKNVGAKVILCGHYDDKTRKTYASCDRVVTYDARRSINSNGAGRGPVKEALYIYEADSGDAQPAGEEQE